MAALAEVLETKCSSYDLPSFMLSPQPVKHMAFCVKSFVFGTSFHEKVIFHLEASLNYFSTKTQALADGERGRRRFLFLENDIQKR